MSCPHHANPALWCARCYPPEDELAALKARLALATAVVEAARRCLVVRDDFGYHAAYKSALAAYDAAKLPPS